MMSINFFKKVAKRIKYQDFKNIYKLIHDAENEESFISECQECMSDYGDNKAVETLRLIYGLKDNPIKSLVAITGLTQSKFSQKYFIALRTIESWISGQRTAPEYVTIMLAYCVLSDEGVL